MSKTSDFADFSMSNLSIPGVVSWNIEGKSVILEINSEEIHIILEIKLNITKMTNKAEIWHDSHFIGRCSADSQHELSKKLINMLVEEVKTRSEKKTEEDINTELCNYLTGEFEKNGLKIVNRSRSVDFGSYVIEGPSGAKYQIKATYKDATVKIRKIINHREQGVLINTFNLSNPKIEKVICSALLEYDQTTLSAEKKKNLIKSMKKEL